MILTKGKGPRETARRRKMPLHNRVEGRGDGHLYGGHQGEELDFVVLRSGRGRQLSHLHLGFHEKGKEETTSFSSAS